MKIPTILVHGSLGSGKTTLIKNLLKDPRFAKSFIVENEFANENIDKTTLADHQDEEAVFDIAGGCICCSSGAELEEALKYIVDKKWDKPVIIETTGVASSVQLIQKLFLNQHFLEHFDFMHNVYVIDPLEVDPASLRGNKSLDVKLADLILINKSDLAGEAALAGIEQAIKELSPETGTLRTSHAVIDSALIKSESRIEERIAEHFADLKAAGTDEHGMSYAVVDIEKPTGKEEIERLLEHIKAQEGITLQRAKGYFADGVGQWWHVECTRHHASWEKTGGKDRAVMVFIGKGINNNLIAQCLKTLS